jgi:hypothetical protein
VLALRVAHWQLAESPQLESHQHFAVVDRARAVLLFSATTLPMGSMQFEHQRLIVHQAALDFLAHAEQLHGWIATGRGT